MPSYAIQKIIYYWTRTVLAISVGLFTIFFLLNVISESYYIYKNRVGEFVKYEAERETYSERSAIEAIDKCSVLGGPVLFSFECLKRELKEFIERDTSNKDLRAQEDMAKWAFATVLVGALGVALSAAGLFGLFISLYLTRKSINISEKVGQAQVRAYLSVEFDSEFASNHKTYPFRILNSGNSPAKRVRYVAGQFVLDHPLSEHQGELISYVPEQRIAFRTVAPGQHLIAEAELDGRLAKDDWDIIKVNGSKRIYLVVRIFYDDFFDEPHETKFCAYSDASPVMVHGVAMTKIDWIGADILNDAT